MAGLTVEMWPIERCVAYARNPRKNDEQVDRMASAIKEFGFRIPIVAKSDGSLVDGHLRLKAAQKLGLKEIPVALADELTEAQVKAFRILANKSANWAEWDTDLLRVEFEELKELDFDLELTGFELPELDEILSAGVDGGTEGQTDPDAVPEPQKEPVSRLGDVWLLGRHRLMCGDSTDAGSVALLMNGEKADMVFTSPPYNGNNSTQRGDFFKGQGTKRLYGDGYGDNLASEEYVVFCEKVLEICFNNTSGYIFWNVNYNANSKFEYIKQIYKFLEYLIEQVCWKKSSAFPLKSCMRRAWEPIYVFSTNKKGLQLEEVESNLWEISNTDSQIEEHRACFPVALPQKALSITKAKIVLEPFCGSGSTLIACEESGASCRGMELDPRYVDVIVRRWQEFTGQEATLESSGKTFDETGAERA